MINIKRFLPSKKVSVLLVVIFVFGAAYLFFPESKNGAENNIAQFNVEFDEKEVRGDFSLEDEDNDGLKNWEESLWKTDPKNPDTDGDGTLDGEEIALKRSPVVPGPDDNFGSGDFSEKELADFGQAQRALTNTDLLARSLFSKYLNLKRFGAIESEETKNALVDSLVSSGFGAPKQKRGFSVSELNIVQSDGPETLRSYANQLGKIIETNAGLTENEIVILAEALKNRDKEKINELDNVVASYEQILEGLLSVSVPEEALEIHSDVIENLLVFKGDVENLRVVFEDPLRTLGTVNTYTDNLSRLGSSLAQLNKLFLEREIIFSRDEPGYMFRLGYN